MREAILATEQNGTALMERKITERMHEVVSQGGVNGLRILFGFESGFINPDQLLPSPGVLAKTVVSDAIEPGREARFPTKAANVFVGLEECFLGQIICERHIASGELSEQTSHGRLVPPNEFRKRVVIIIEQDSSDKVCIRQRHPRRL